ncbi:uncharacterized protein [Drosophila takahashii]|uniref:uncharacterized protein isoform X2 n=1 Tax=Drosophila takahashii TaxID=29030 RepID=UPI0038991CED
MDVILNRLKGQAFLQIFQELNITEESMKHLQWEQLQSRIPDRLFGDAVIFFKNLKKWQISATKKEGEENFNVDVSTILLESKNGKHILSQFALERTLGFKYRKCLSQTIVEHLLSEEIKVSQRLFSEIAEQITLLFDSEIKDTYFIKNKGKKPKGLLYQKFYNLKSKFKIGLVNQPLSKTNEFYENEDLFEVSKHWLRYNVEPITEVLAKWELIFDQRISYFKSSVTLVDIFREFPILCQSFGHILIESDFRRLFPENADLLFNNWNSFKKKIIPLFRKNISNKKCLAVLKEIKSDDYDVPDALICFLLPALLVPSARGKRKNGSQGSKYSIEDARNGFLTWKPNLSELQSVIKTEVDDAFVLKKRYQPKICCIGSSPLALKKFYVHTSGVFYEFDNILSSLNACFQLFHVLNIEYPEEASLVWTLIQKHLFKIDLDVDLKSRALSELLNDLKH